MRGDRAVLYFTVTTDYSSNFDVEFVVKATSDPSANRLIQKQNSDAGGDSSEVYVTSDTIQVTITTNNTLNWAARNYYYDIVIEANGGGETDTITIFQGSFTVLQDISSPTDGTVPGSIPVYVVALDTPNASPSFLIGQDSDNSWDVVSKSAFRDTIGLVTVGVKEFGAKIDNSTDDLEAINNAIASLTNGGTLVWNRGTSDTCLISGEIIGLPNIIYDFNGVTLKLADDSDTTMMKFADASNTVFKNGTFYGNMLNQTAEFTPGDATTIGKYRRGIHILSGDNVTFDNMEFNKIRYTAVFINPPSDNETDIVTNYKFINCRFIDMGAFGMLLSEMEDVLVTGCYFEDWGWFTNDSGSGGLDVWTSDPGMILVDGSFSVDYMKIINNTFYAVSNSAFSIINVRPMIGAQIIGNSFFGNYIGISGYWINSTFSNNLFDSSSVATHRSGLEIPGYNLMVSNNIVTNGSIFVGSAIGNLAHGDIDTIHGRNVNIIGNIVKNQGASHIGISIGSSIEDDSLAHFNISDNIVDMTGSSGSSVGIYIGQGALAKINGMDLNNNMVIKTDGKTGTGIRFYTKYGSNNIRVTGGKAWGFANGIQFTDTSTTLDDIYITGVDVRNNTTAIKQSNTFALGNLYIKNNLGYNTYASGVDSIDAGTTTTATIAHGLDYVPTTTNSVVTITYTSTLSSAAYVYVSTLDGTNIQFTSDADPSGADIFFTWEIKHREDVTN